MRRNASRKPAHPIPPRGRRTVRLLMERLEERYLLATFSQTGSTLSAALAPNQTVTLSALASTERLTLSSGVWSGNVTGVTGNGTGTISVTPAGASFNTIQITDSGTNAGDAVTFADSGTNTYPDSVQVSLTSAGAGPIVFNGATSFTGASALSAVTAQNVIVNSGASVTTVNGNLLLNGASGNGAGVLITGATTVVSTVNGNISITGAGTAANVDGIEVSGAVVQATGTGQITLNGSSPAGPGNIGIDITRGGRVTAGGGDATKALGLAAGSTIVVALDPTRATSTGYQYVHVDGSVNLGGATLQATGTGSLALGAAYTVVNPQGGTSTGAFNGLAEGSSTTIGGRRYVVTYAGGNGRNEMLLEEDPVSVQAGGLQFQAVGGGGFVVSGNTYTTTANVQVGYVPAAGASFTPLLLLTGTTTVDTSATTVSATGPMSGILSGTSIGLLDSLPTTSIASLISTTGISGLSGTSFTVAGVNFTLNTLDLSATGNAGQPEILLQGSVALPTVGLVVAVNGSNFVDITSSGVTLTGVTASLNGTFTVASATFTAGALIAEYTPANNVFTITGSASVAVSGIAGLSVSFGYGTGATALPGLVVSNGTLASIMNMTVDGSFTVKQVAITATGLDFSYATATQTFAMSGSAVVSVTGIAGLSVTFGSTVSGTVNPGLVVAGGSLQSLDMTIESNITVSSVTFNTTGLAFTYSGATSQFALPGGVGVSVSVSGIASLSVNFGSTVDGIVTPGLIITSGTLQSLDMTVNGSFTVASVTFTATGLELTYSAAGSQFTLVGTAAVSISGLGSLGVTFGSTVSGTVTPGLVVTSGSLQSLDMTVNGSFTVASVTVTATNLQLTYSAAASQFTFAGTAAVSISGLGSLGVTFGSTVSGTVTPGLLIASGTLQSLDMTVESFTVASVTITGTDLQLNYTAVGAQFSLSGTADVSVTGMTGNLTVAFGNTTDGTVTPGLSLSSGALQSLDMTVNGSASRSRASRSSATRTCNSPTARPRASSISPAPRP